MMGYIRAVLISIIGLCLVAEVSCGNFQDHRPAIFVAQLSNGVNETFCAAYYPNITSSLPERPSEVSYQLFDTTATRDSCSQNFNQTVNGKIVIINRGNCSLGERTFFLKRKGAAGMAVVTPSAINIATVEQFEKDFIFILINPSTKQKVSTLGKDLRVSVYSPSDDPYWDFSLLVIFLLAVGTVATGSYWSGIIRYRLCTKTVGVVPDEPSVYALRKSSNREEVSVSLTPGMAAIFVMSMVFMLMLLYFFFSYLVYFIIGLFAFASATAVYQCLEPLLSKITCLCCSATISCRQKEIRINQICLLLFACTLSIIWVVFRREPWAWILQDILGVAFSINMLKLIRLPNFKICTILLVLLFFYDIFFVFITPFFTKNGESIMVEVAAGGRTGSAVGGSTGASAEEQLPMVLRVPHLGYQAFGACYERFSLLGFGDILVPGLLVSFCHYFDLKAQTPYKIYYVSSLAAYAGGLIATFAGLFLMGMAQPALLYLVPFTLTTVTGIALFRGELKSIWNESEKSAASSIEDGPSDSPSTYGTVDTSPVAEENDLVEKK